MNSSREINLWCPFRNDLRDVMWICYLPSAILHHLSTQALQNCFLMKCKLRSSHPSQLVKKDLPLCYSNSSHPSCSSGKFWLAWEMAKLSLEAQDSHQALGCCLPGPDAVAALSSTVFCHAVPFHSQDTEQNKTTTYWTLFYHSSCPFLLSLIKDTIWILHMEDDETKPTHFLVMREGDDAS